MIYSFVNKVTETIGWEITIRNTKSYDKSTGRLPLGAAESKTQGFVYKTLLPFG